MLHGLNVFFIGFYYPYQQGNKEYHKDEQGDYRKNFHILYPLEIMFKHGFDNDW
jgi:hypothetical protein